MLKIKTNLGGLYFFLLAASVTLGFNVAISGVQAKIVITNHEELMQKINEANVGWDWIPSCTEQTHWSIEKNRCTSGGNHESESYELADISELIAKIHEVNVGWNWEPSCGEDARWNWDGSYCQGGTDSQAEY